MRYLNWMRFILVNLYSCTLKKMWNRTIINLMMRILCGYYGRPTWIRYIKTKRNMIILITHQWHKWSEHRWKQSKRVSKSNPMDNACLWCKNVWTQDLKKPKPHDAPLNTLIFLAFTQWPYNLKHSLLSLFYSSNPSLSISFKYNPTKS